VQTHEFYINVGVAAVLGAAIGIERQMHQRKAGLRTNVLVALGSAAFVAIGAFVPHEDSQSRVAASVVSGVGFLGAGVIFKDGATIKGLDTAATVWCSAAVGALAGWGQLGAATFVTLVVLLTNTLVRPFIKRIDKQARAAKESPAAFRATLLCAERDDDDVRDLLLAEISASNLLLRSITRTKTRDADDNVHHAISAELVGTLADQRAVEKIAAKLTIDPRVESASWRLAEPADAPGGNGAAD
jgi:putative Mg2+ transporter-C (MgtC) family protein